MTTFASLFAPLAAGLPWRRREEKRGEKIDRELALSLFSLPLTLIVYLFPGRGGKRRTRAEGSGERSLLHTFPPPFFRPEDDRDQIPRNVMCRTLHLPKRRVFFLSRDVQVHLVPLLPLSLRPGKGPIALELAIVVPALAPALTNKSGEESGQRGEVRPYSRFLPDFSGEQ